MSKPIPSISYHQALRFFERPAEMAREFNVERASVAEWKKAGRLPQGRVWEFITRWPGRWRQIRRTHKATPSQRARRGTKK